MELYRRIVKKTNTMQDFPYIYELTFESLGAIGFFKLI